MHACSILLICSVILDRVIGDPSYQWHPVRLIGKTIRLLEGLIRNSGIPDIWGGILLTVITLFVWETLLFFLFRAASFYKSIGFLFSLFVLYSCIALQDIVKHVRPLISALENSDIKKSRELLQKVVGRDTSALNELGIIKAAIETISEGFVDGFLSPVFWFSIFSLIGYASIGQSCLLGLAGVLGYRIVNTLDSMIGYRSETYFRFGRFAARLDDVANFIPARLSILFLFLGSWLLRWDAAAGLESTIRYRLQASSPNAGHPESFVAGVFHIRLGGLTRYPFGEVKKPIIGDGDSRPTIETVRQVLRLVTISGYLAAGIFFIFLYVLPLIRPLDRF